MLTAIFTLVLVKRESLSCCRSGKGRNSAAYNRGAIAVLAYTIPMLSPSTVASGFIDSIEDTVGFGP
jgi:hypothetical protein